MRIVYDSDSIEVTTQIINNLLILGYGEAESLIVSEIDAFERTIPDLLEVGRDLLRQNRIEEAIRLFFYSPSAPNYLQPIGQELLRELKIGTPSTRTGIRDAILSAATLVQQQDFPARLPLNVLAALDVLFHLIVLPRRSYQRASDIFQRLLGVQLQVCDENGAPVYGLREQETAAREEAAFWTLFDAVVTEWGMEQFRDAAPVVQATPILPEYVDAYVRAAAGRIVFDLNRERVAA